MPSTIRKDRALEKIWKPKDPKMALMADNLNILNQRLNNLEVVDGDVSVKTDGGIRIVPFGASPIPPHPWQINFKKVEEVDGITIRPGSIDGIVPNNIFSFFPIDLEVTQYVVLNVVTNNAGVVSCNISIDSVAPASSGTSENAAPDNFTDILGIIFEGKVFQIRSKNLSCQTQMVLSVPTVTVEPWRENLIKFYKWNVTE